MNDSVREGSAPDNRSGARSTDNRDDGREDSVALNVAHDALIAQDTILGLRAELATVKKKLAKLENANIGQAYARIDKLEDQREAMLHELRWAIKSQRQELANVKASTTWRVGSLVVRPFSKLRRLGRS